jgi:hypothetical protein
MFSFLKISMKLQVANPSHEQIKSVQSSIKSAQVWSSINNFFLEQIHCQPTQWIQVNHTLETSWKYLNNHVWWCCVKIYLRVLLILITVNCLQSIMKMGILVVWRWWVMLTPYFGPWIIHHPQRCMWYWPYRMVRSKTWYINHTIENMTS